MVKCVAVTLAGATPRSTHASSAAIMSKELGPGPPAQCPIPGAMKRRKKSCVSRIAASRPSPPITDATSSKYEMELSREMS